MKKFKNVEEALNFYGFNAKEIFEKATKMCGDKNVTVDVNKYEGVLQNSVLPDYDIWSVGYGDFVITDEKQETIHKFSVDNILF